MLACSHLLLDVLAAVPVQLQLRGRLGRAVVALRCCKGVGRAVVALRCCEGVGCGCSCLL